MKKPMPKKMEMREDMPKKGGMKRDMDMDHPKAMMAAKRMMGGKQK